MSIAEYIIRKNIIQNTLFRIQSDGVGYFIEGDKKYTKEDFIKKYPLQYSFVSHTNSVEGHLDWMVVK